MIGRWGVGGGGGEQAVTSLRETSCGTDGHQNWKKNPTVLHTANGKTGKESCYLYHVHV